MRDLVLGLPAFPQVPLGVNGPCVFPPHPLPAGFIDIGVETIMQVCFYHQQKVQCLMLLPLRLR